jgi:hypothetical protein
VPIGFGLREVLFLLHLRAERQGLGRGHINAGFAEERLG